VYLHVWVQKVEKKDDLTTDLACHFATDAGDILGKNCFLTSTVTYPQMRDYR